MKKLLTIPVLALLTILFSGCPNPNNPKYLEGVFPTSPINFSEINSEYDDYNSALPIINHSQYIYFSSSRNSSGESFDIVGDNLNITWDMETGYLSINNYEPNYYIDFTETLFNMINTTADEFGPYSLNYWVPNSHDDYYKYDLVTYSSNFEADYYKSKFAYFKSDGNGNGTYHGPYDISLVDSAIDLQYISFFSEEINDISYWEMDPLLFEQMIFNINDNGNTGIYNITLPEDTDFIEMLKGDTPIHPEIISQVNSVSEDKCPFVNTRLMVFSSNREGGMGGYDLYYSWYENGIWSDPINFGDGINTEHDEFRPVTVEVNDFTTDLMIFSSNRPGGKGGFDLYYVGLPFKVRTVGSIK